jgi:hypothetical protein
LNNDVFQNGPAAGRLEGDVRDRNNGQDRFKVCRYGYNYPVALNNFIFRNTATCSINFCAATNRVIVSDFDIGINWFEIAQNGCVNRSRTNFVAVQISGNAVRAVTGGNTIPGSFTGCVAGFGIKQKNSPKFNNTQYD